MHDLKITSLANPKVKRVVALRDRRDRDQEGVFLIEGYREIKRALDAHFPLETLFYCREWFLGENEDELLRRAPHVIECTKEVFHKLSYRDRPDGLLAVAPKRERKLSELRLSLNPFLIVAEQIEKPGNLGTILRSADAAGVDGLILADPTTDLFNPNVVRASVGTLFTVPCYEATSEASLLYLKQHGVKIVAATPHATHEFTRVDLTGPIAIAVGAEQYGLSDAWMKEADIQVKIPMLGVADSLNVATATTLMLYEVVRQRRILR